MLWTDNPSAGMQPFYFSSAGADLYGCYHAPSSGPSFDCGLVMCNPLGHEYIQTHRAVRQLATLLARSGFPVLRFDYYGCGDSAGDHRHWSLERWRDDVSGAVDTLRQNAGVNRVCTIGLRLGGALSALAGSENGDIDGMVLWDPVIRGRDYLDELTGTHQEMLRQAHVRAGKDDSVPELLGFPLPQMLRTELEQLDLLTLKTSPAERVLVIESHEAVKQASLCRSLQSLGIPGLQHRQFTNPHLWAWLEDFGRAHVPNEILQDVVSWVSAEFA